MNEDGSLHEGKFELLIWDMPANLNDASNSWDMGWDATIQENGEELKAKFLVCFCYCSGSTYG